MNLSAHLCTVLITALAAVLGIAATDGFAQTLRNERPQQLSEHAKPDQGTIDAMQRRLDALGSLKSPRNAWDIYHLAKAQAWLDFAFDARTQRDTSGVIDETLAQDDKLTAMLEAEDKNISLDTPIIPSSVKLREDIWRKAEEMKKHQGFRCAASRIAQFEVQLVQAGHAYKTLGWRHAKPYVQTAERLSREAEASLDACPPPVTTAEQLPPEIAKQPPAAQVRMLAKRVHFAYRLTEICYATAQVLEQVSYVLRNNPELTVELQGHADKRGSKRYNRKLSKQRAQAVKAYLLHSRVAEQRLGISAFGKTQPLAKGDTSLDYARNRRVEFIVSPEAGVTVTPQEDDLQIERHKARRK